MMNNQKNVVIDFLLSLQDSKKSVAESTANKKSSESLEDTFQKSLVDGGLVDLTLELEKGHQGQTNYFSTSLTKSARVRRWKEIKEYINNYGTSTHQMLRKDEQGIFPSNCFIRHPNGSQNHIDFLIIVNGWMLYWEIKTGGGLSGKLNDRPIPSQFFVLSCSRHKTVKDKPFTWFQMGDIMSTEAYQEADVADLLIDKFKKELALVTGKTDFLK